MSQYPVVYAGQRLTGSFVQSMLPLEFWKVTTTDRSSTTTLADDPDLTTLLDANATYKVEFHLHYAATPPAGTGQFKTAWTVPASATGNRTAHGMASTVSDSSSAPTGGGAGDGRSGVHGFATAVTYGDRASTTNQCFALEEGVVVTTNAGTLAIQWAQVTSSATVTRLSAGSFLRVKRLA